jgi:ribosomal protein S12 methylthiotransferase
MMGNRKSFPQDAPINVITLGCSKNTVDSENLMGALRRGGFRVVHDAPGEGFAGVIINTCGFILDAKQESIDTILDYARARKEGRIGKLVVMGCLSQRYRKDLQAEIPEVDAFLGVNEPAKVVAQFLSSAAAPSWHDRIVSTPSHYAYMKVSEGCDHQCSFCAIPLIRGPHHSRPLEEIVAEALHLKAGGVKELLLIAQDLTWYGMDIYERRMLPDLLRALTEAEAADWIRLHYTFPTAFPMEVLDIMRDHPAICNYLDLPLQHISDRILKSMRRGGAGQALDLAEKVRTMYPEIAMRTTMIVGYPGETEQEFNALLDFVKETRFERLGAFVYSHEEDTPAFELEDNIPAEEKEARLAALMEIQAEISLVHNQNLIGQSLRILIDRKEGDFWIGRTEYDSPEVDNEVLIPASEAVSLSPGVFCNAIPLEASEHELFARIN